MVEKEVISFALIGFFVVLSLMTFVLVYIGDYVSPGVFTGRVMTSGAISLDVNEPLDGILIFSPENKTYNFSKGDDYELDLNVSATFSAVRWNYSLYDLKHGEYVYTDVGFSPNTSFNAVRWGNILYVEAEDGDGSMFKNNVTFYISVPNSEPQLDLPEELYICEKKKMDYRFNATDIDEDELEFGISPLNPFFVLGAGEFNGTIKYGRLVSYNLTKPRYLDINSGFKRYEETVYVEDEVGDISSEVVDIFVIERNNAPEIEDIGAQTVYLAGEGSIFEKIVDAEDIESESLEYSLKFEGNESLFNISEEGLMNYTPSANDTGVYNLEVCVNDTGLSSPHENISDVCGQDGGELQSCDFFSLTVTNENRAPRIDSYSPENLSFTQNSDDRLDFVVNVSDPDATIPDVYWYVDSSLKEHDEATVSNSFAYNFGCGVGGTHSIVANVSDGLNYTLLEWTVSLNKVACARPSDSGSGGGGGGGALAGFCKEEWGCVGWRVCQNVERSFEAGILSPEDYYRFKEICAQEGLEQSNCGFQLRSCADLNNCNNSEYKVEKPFEMRVCHYTLNPSCSDGIKNCHDGGCEFLVDCGGPCSPCASCSDGIQNQGEEGIDCGGPCPWQCELETPMTQNYFLWGLILILILVVIFIIIQAVRIIRFKMKEGERWIR